MKHDPTYQIDNILFLALLLNANLKLRINPDNLKNYSAIEGPFVTVGIRDLWLIWMWKTHDLQVHLQMIGKSKKLFKYN